MKQVTQPETNGADAAEAVERGKSKAEEYLGNPSKIKRLADEAWEKAKNYERDRSNERDENYKKARGPFDSVWGYFMALIRLLKAYARKEYRDIPWASIVLVTVAIIYFVSPIDLIPDFIPVAGYVDDAAVIAFVIAQIKADLDNFIAWEKRQEHRPCAIVVEETRRPTHRLEWNPTCHSWLIVSPVRQP